MIKKIIILSFLAFNPLYTMERPKTPAPIVTSIDKLDFFKDCQPELFAELLLFLSVLANPVTEKILNERFSDYSNFCEYLFEMFGVDLDDVLFLQHKVD